MADEPSAQTNNENSEQPAPEVLVPRAEENGAEPEVESTPDSNPGERPAQKRATYRPSHRATFIGLAVVVAVLAINAIVIAFVIKSQSKSLSKVNTEQVTISQSTLDKLGVNRSSVGDLGALLTVGPNAQFNGDVTVGKDVSISGQLKLNSKFTANEASLAQLEAGNTSLSALNVNGDTTSSNLNLRKDLIVTGTSRLQGPTIISQLLTVNNNVNIAGSVAVGGTLSVNSLHVSSLTLDSNLTIGGHVITRGSAPSVSTGPCIGSNGTVSISGNDASGTVAVNTGAGATGCVLVRITFNSKYGNTPHVVVTAVGSGAESVYITNRTSSGFEIGVKSITVGGHAFDYIVEQ
jgi:hypothetical protein